MVNHDSKFFSLLTGFYILSQDISLKNSICIFPMLVGNWFQVFNYCLIAFSILLQLHNSLVGLLKVSALIWDFTFLTFSPFLCLCECDYWNIPWHKFPKVKMFLNITFKFSQLIHTICHLYTCIFIGEFFFCFCPWFFWQGVRCCLFNNLASISNNFWQRKPLV